MSGNIHIRQAILLIKSACVEHMNVLRLKGEINQYDKYSDAIGVFDDWMQYIQNKEEEEAMTNGDWGDDIYDHSEERERDRLLGEQEELAGEEVDRRYE